MSTVIDNGVRIAMMAILALLLAASDAAAQGMPGFPEGPAANSMPSLALGLSPSGMRALDEDIAADHLTLNAFGKKPSMDRFKDGGFQRVTPWTFYGRLGVFNFQDTLDPSRSEGGQITLKRTGPKLTGRYYIGIHRTF